MTLKRIGIAVFGLGLIAGGIKAAKNYRHSEFKARLAGITDCEDGGIVVKLEGGTQFWTPADQRELIQSAAAKDLLHIRIDRLPRRRDGLRVGALVLNDQAADAKE